MYIKSGFNAENKVVTQYKMLEFNKLFIYIV